MSLEVGFYKNSEGVLMFKLVKAGPVEAQPCASFEFDDVATEQHKKQYKEAYEQYLKSIEQ